MAECIQQHPSMFDRNLYCVVPTYKHMLSRINDAVDAKLEASPHITEEAKENIGSILYRAMYDYRSELNANLYGGLFAGTLTSGQWRNLAWKIPGNFTRSYYCSIPDWTSHSPVSSAAKSKVTE
jgi:hypothetical protein